MPTLDVAATLASQHAIGPGGFVSFGGCAAVVMGVLLVGSGKVPKGRLENHPSARRPVTVAGVTLLSIGVVALVAGLSSASSKRAPLIAIALAVGLSAVLAGSVYLAGQLQSRRSDRAV